ncbi:MAG: hypothetical protein ABR558_01835 [Thioalkalivibrio sp.]
MSMVVLRRLRRRHDSCVQVVAGLFSAHGTLQCWRLAGVDLKPDVEGRLVVFEVNGGPARHAIQGICNEVISQWIINGFIGRRVAHRSSEAVVG